MNIFRLAGDMSHVFSILVLLLRLRVAKNAQGGFSLRALAFLTFSGGIHESVVHFLLHLMVYFSSLFL
jgi:hypothetical protein